MNETLQLVRDHAFDVIAIAAILAAVLPPSADPRSVWGRLRQALDVIGLNVGAARNQGEAARETLNLVAQLVERKGLVRDEQRPTQAGLETRPNRRPPTGGPPGGPG